MITRKTGPLSISEELGVRVISKMRSILQKLAAGVGAFKKWGPRCTSVEIVGL